MNIVNFYTASTREAWSCVPFISLNFPIIGAIFSLDFFALTTAIAILILVVNHNLNHHIAQAGNGRLAGFRKSISNFWNTQTLERVHLKWRQLTTRSTICRNNVMDYAQPSVNTLANKFPGVVTPNAVASQYLHTEHQAHKHIEENIVTHKYTNRLPAAWTNLSDKQGKTTVVWLSVTFFVQQRSNSFGQIPLCSAVTGQAGFTQGISIALLISITYLGVKRQGIRFVRLFLPRGPSWPIAPIFILLESISYRFRSISLGTRLYCNIFRGHQLQHQFTSLSLVPVLTLPILIGAPFTMIAAAILMALSALETIVAILQAGVFCLQRGFYVTEVLSYKDKLDLCSNK